MSRNDPNPHYKDRREISDKWLASCQPFAVRTALPGGLSVCPDGDMDHAIQLIRGFEQLAIQLCLTLCTVSPIARMAWNELKSWRTPTRKHTSQTTR